MILNKNSSVDSPPVAFRPGGMCDAEVRGFYYDGGHPSHKSLRLQQGLIKITQG
jgi:hypothetical protein